MSYTRELKKALKDTGSTYWFLLKIMIPISIIVKVLDYYGLIETIGQALNPAMGVVGLPGEFGLVVATAMLVNIYGAAIVLFTLSLTYTYTVAEVSILACMMLIAHTLPIEARIAQKAGVRLWFTLSFRIILAFVFGFILHIIFSTFHLFQGKNVMIWQPGYTDPTLFEWAISQVGYYFMIFLIILSLTIFLRILKNTGALERINNFLKPGMRFLGMSKNAAIIPIIGNTLGLAYGGGVIVKEAKNKSISKKDIFLSLSFLGLSHSLIEDTLLTLAIGASIFAIFFGRIAFTIIVIVILAKIVNMLSKKTFEKYLMNN